MKTKDLSNKQKIILTANSVGTDNTFIVSKIEEGQQKIFKCVECGVERDFSDSVEYGSAVHMWNQRGGMCAACYRKKTGILLY